MEKVCDCMIDDSNKEIERLETILRNKRKIKSLLDELYMLEKPQICPDLFPLSEIEHCVTIFTGDDDAQVNTFVLDFEEVATLCGWSEVKKFVYAKRFIRGTAAKFLRIIRPQTWIRMRDELLAEFSTTISECSLHKQLAERKIAIGETHQQYYISMREIAAQGHISEADIVYYIVRGLARNQPEMLFFIKAETFKDLRILFQQYNQVIRTDEEMCHQQVPVVCSTRNKPRNLRCFKCNGIGHFALSCRMNNRIRVKSDNKSNYFISRQMSPQITDEAAVIKNPNFGAYKNHLDNASSSSGTSNSCTSNMNTIGGHIENHAEIQSVEREPETNFNTTRMTHLNADNENWRTHEHQYLKNGQRIWSDFVVDWRLPQIPRMYSAEESNNFRQRQ